MTPGGHQGARIAVKIDRLVLEGVRPADRARIAEAFERELARLLVERTPATLTRQSAWPALDGGQFVASQDATPETIGTGVARAVYAGFTTPAPHRTGRKREGVASQ